MGTPLLDVQAISKYKGAQRILSEVSLSVEQGTVCCIIGPSGSGKTTLLKCINMLNHIDDGAIQMDGREVIASKSHERTLNLWRGITERLLWGQVSPRKIERDVAIQGHLHRRRVGMVFQDFNLWPRRTVLGNLIEGPVYGKGEKREDAIERAHDLLRKFGMQDMAGRYPSSLSGGERQRVAIVRALMMQCKILLADEITSALDPERVGEVLEMFRGLAREGMTMCIVTHHLEFARQVSDQIVMMDEGAVVECGSPTQVLETPDSKRTSEFIRDIKKGEGDSSAAP